jgi:predicted amidohydrolase
MNKFKVAVIQTKPICGNLKHNRKVATDLIKRAAKKGAQIICLPELFDTGYDLEWIRSNAGMNTRETKEILKKLSNDLRVLIIAGIANLREGQIYNSSYMFSPPGQVVGRYDKNFLFKAKPQEEHKYFKESDEMEVVETPLGKLGFAICNDIRYASLFGDQAIDGVKIIFVSSAWGKTRLEHWTTLLKARAIENQIYIVAANQIGKAGGVEFAGHSMIVDYDGNVLEEKKGGEGVIIAEVDYLALKEKRRELPTFNTLKEKS